jgi:hypothetical protein
MELFWTSAAKTMHPGLLTLGSHGYRSCQVCCLKGSFDKERFERAEAAKNQVLARQQDFERRQAQLLRIVWYIYDPYI